MPRIRFQRLLNKTINRPFMDTFNQADIAVLLIALYFTCLGWVQGVLPFALALLAFAISGQIAFAVFQTTQNILDSLKILLLLSFLLPVAAWGGLWLWNKTVIKSYRCAPLSHWLGAAIGLGWGSFFALVLMVLFVLTPVDKPFLKNAKKISQRSYVYTFAERHFLSRYPIYRTFQSLDGDPVRVPDPSAPSILDLRKSISQKDLEAIRQDEKLQGLLADEEIQQLVEKKDFGGLMSNPKVQNLLKDKVFVEKLLKFYSDAVSRQ